MLPESGKDEDFRDAVINQLPIWEMIDRMAKDGIAVHHYAYRPGWVTLEISWHMAHMVWEHAVCASQIKDVVKQYVEEQGYVFNHWNLIPPKKELWTETLDAEARDAKVFLRTFAMEIQDDRTLDRMVKDRAKVNTNILAKLFEMLEKEGQHDRD